MERFFSQPFFVAGTGRYCSELCAACPRVLGKLGAEGFYGAALLDRGWGLAVKIECGSLGPQYNVAQAVLEGAGVVPDAAAAALAHFARTPLSTVRGEVIGHREAAAWIREDVRRATAAALGSGR